MNPRPTDRTEVAARLAAAVGRINRRARTDSASLGYGIVSALASIQRHGPLRPGDLSRIEVVTKPTMTRILTELEQRGFIQREADPRDGRAFMVTATPEGIEAVEQARANRTGIVAGLIAEPRRVGRPGDRRGPGGARACRAGRARPGTSHLLVADRPLPNRYQPVDGPFCQRSWMRCPV
ncbi:MarR family winged helix-turn-helix transcriptional regulator [Curtobacterium flaccumfaciens]